MSIASLFAALFALSWCVRLSRDLRSLRQELEVAEMSRRIELNALRDALATESRRLRHEIEMQRAPLESSPIGRVKALLGR